MSYPIQHSNEYGEDPTYQINLILLQFPPVITIFPQLSPPGPVFSRLLLTLVLEHILYRTVQHELLAIGAKGKDFDRVVRARFHRGPHGVAESENLWKKMRRRVSGCEDKTGRVKLLRCTMYKIVRVRRIWKAVGLNR